MTRPDASPAPEPPALKACSQCPKQLPAEAPMPDPARHHFCGYCGRGLKEAAIRRESVRTQGVLLGYFGALLGFFIVWIVIGRIGTGWSAQAETLLQDLSFVALSLVFIFLERATFRKSLTIPPGGLPWWSLVLLPVLAAGFLLVQAGYFSALIFVVPPFLDDLTSAPNGYHHPAIALLSLALMPALFEEFTFRGILQPRVQQMFGLWPALVFQAAFFALIHFNFIGLPWLMLIGLGFGFLRHHFGHIWLGVGWHFLHNSFHALRDFYPEAIPWFGS